MRTLRAIAHATVRALRAMVRAPRSTIWVIGAVALAFVLLGLVQLGAHNLGVATDRLGGAHMSVYLDDHIAEQDVAVIADALASLPEVVDHTYVSRTAALERIRTALGDTGHEEDLVAGIEVGLIPASVELLLDPGIRNAAALEPVVTRLEAVPGVESVEVSAAWIDRVSAVRDHLSWLGWLILLVVATACGFFVTTAVGLHARPSHRHTEVLELVGASAFFVRGPVMLAGVIQGVLGATLAVALLWLFYQSVAEAVTLIASNATDQAIGFGFLPPAQVAWLVIAGGLLGLLGGALATRQSSRRPAVRQATHCSRIQTQNHALA